MKYYELRCTSYIKKDITFKKSFEVISKYISFSMSQTDEYKFLHNEEKGFKHYCFGNFFPIEKEQITTKGNTYEFVLRSLDEDFIDTLSKNLRANINNEYFVVVDTQKKFVKQFFISELYTATPTIVSTQNNMFWTTQKDGDIVSLQKKLHDNLEKKYQDFYKEEIKGDQNFIQLLEIKNKLPQSIYSTTTIEKTKKVNELRFFGNKFKIVPNEDEVSQNLAFMALASGLGEKNSFGGGFCLGKGLQ